MPRTPPLRRPQAADHAWRLLREQRWAALASSGEAGPLCSQVAFVPEPDGGGLLLHLSHLAAHTANLLQRPRASLSIGEPDDGREDPQTLRRVTVWGAVSAIERPSARYDSGRALYIARLPASKPLFEFPDFVLFKLEIEGVRFVGGFGAALDLDGVDLRAAARGDG